MSLSLNYFQDDICLFDFFVPLENAYGGVITPGEGQQIETY